MSVLKPTLLLVDDEQIITSSLCAFLDLEPNYRVVSCNCPLQALQAFEKESVDLVVSDFLMPGMDGLELLGRMRKLDPRVPRVLLTGYADKDTAIKAINDGGLYQYLEKPWDNDHLRLVLRNALEHRRLLLDLDDKLLEFAGAREELDELRSKLLRAFV